MSRTTILSTLSLITPVILIGCAANVELPTEQLALAEANIRQAEQSGAREHSVLELAEAREKLEQARAAVAEDENTRGLMLAEQAAADAELAMARARSAAAQEAADELRASIDVLRREATRQ